MTEEKVSPRPSHYSPAAIRLSLMHFLFGKGVSAVATFLVLLVIVRELGVDEFAAYTSLHALVLIIGLISSLGVPQVLHRFLPELRTHHNNKAMYALLGSGIAVRAALYGSVCLLLIPALDLVAQTFKLTDWTYLIRWYFLVGFLRVNSTFIAQALESLLWQRDAQYSLAAGGLVKLGGTLYVISIGNFGLQEFVFVECVAEAVAMLLLFLFMGARWLRDRDRAHGDFALLQKDGRRYMRFGFWCYLQNVTSIFYGSAPNRLFVAYFMAAEYIAIFGLIDRLIDFARRYEPLNMFVGLVRPVLMSRFSASSNFGQLVRLGNLVLLANYLVLAAPVVVLLVAGDEIIYWISDGKYGDIALLLAAFYAVLLVNSVSNLLDMLVKAVEENRIYLLSNMFLSGSLLLAAPLIPYVGLWSIAIANMVGLLIAITIIDRHLRACSYVYVFDWGHWGQVAMYCLLGVVAGLALAWLGMPPVAAGAIAVSGYVVLAVLALPVGADDKATMLEIMPARVRAFF